MLKDHDDDDKGFLSSFGTHEDAMLSLPMACYHHRLKSVVMFGTKMAVQQNLPGIWKNLILITFDFALLNNTSWIAVLKIINILQVQ